MQCKVCNNFHNNKFFKIRDMFFKHGNYFDYMECGHCSSLQLMDVPTNMRKYYPNNSYYSFQKKSNMFLKRILTTKRNEFALFKKSFLGKLLYKKYPNQLLYIIGKCKLKNDSAILDLGCGSGNLLYSLKNSGFTNLNGIDPYLEKEIIIPHLKLMKKTLNDLPKEDKFDLIIFSHSLEHMDNHYEIMQKVSEILKDEGYIIVSMPVKTDYIWKLYGINWVQIDAPRHFFIHSLKSFDILIKKTNLNINHINFNSNEFLFWGSEQYTNNIPLNAANSYSINPKKSIFSKNQMKEFTKKAYELNNKNQSDQAIFILKKNT